MEYEFTTAPLPPDGRARNGPRNPLWVAVAEFGRAHPSEWFKAHVGGRGSMSAYGAQIKKGRLVAFRGGIWADRNPSSG